MNALSTDTRTPITHLTIVRTDVTRPFGGRASGGLT